MYYVLYRFSSRWEVFGSSFDVFEFACDCARTQVRRLKGIAEDDVVVVSVTDLGKFGYRVEVTA